MGLKLVGPSRPFEKVSGTVWDSSSFCYFFFFFSTSGFGKVFYDRDYDLVLYACFVFLSFL